MMHPAAPLWTPRRRLIVIAVALVWLIIGGVFLAALGNTQSTDATYALDEVSITVRTDKSLAIMFFQCVNFSWDSENITLYDTREFGFTANVLTKAGERYACNSNDARVIGRLSNEGDLDNVYPQLTWINPAAMILIGMSATILGVLLWAPAWLGAVKGPQIHLIFTPVVIIFALMTQAVNPLEVNFDIAIPMLAVVPISVIGLGLVYLFRSRPGQLFRIACATMVVITTLLTIYHFFTVPGLLNYDEIYYSSIAATGSTGLGLYPFVQNYPPMPVMGGIGHWAWLYVATYTLFGPTVWSVRLAALLMYLPALPAIFILFRRWYGTAAAWLAVALIPATYFYAISHSLRMDTITLTWIWWGLVMVDTARQRQTWRWHLAAGLFLGLGLEAHIHTSVVTIACGILYLTDYVSEVWRNGRLVWPRAVVMYSIGALLGLGVFVVFNILPDPDAFLRTAGNAARLTTISVDKNLSTTERVLRSFLALESFAQITVQRIFYVFRYVPIFDLLLGLVAFTTLFTRRRSPADRTALILLAGTLFAGFFILNGASLYYTLHMFPVTVLCLPSFFTHGYLRRGAFTIPWQDVSSHLLLVLLPLIFPLYLSIAITWPRALDYDSILVKTNQETVDYIRTNVSHECVVMGPGYLFQVTFMDYPRYHTHTAEVALGMEYYGFKDYAQIWPHLNPDVIFGQFQDRFAPSLHEYIATHQYEEIAPAIWQKTQEPLSPDCIIQTANPVS